MALPSRVKTEYSVELYIVKKTSTNKIEDGILVSGLQANGNTT